MIIPHKHFNKLCRRSMGIKYVESLKHDSYMNSLSNI